jgi:drug/metabolite transporter (DMT)-like permease
MGIHAKAAAHWQVGGRVSMRRQVTATAHPPERRLYALGLRLFAISCFSLMSVLIKLASEGGIVLLELVFWRQAFALPIVLAIIWWGPGLASVATDRPVAHAVRSVMGLVSIVLTFGAVTLLPLAEATILSYATPIFATILSVLFFNEKVGLRRALAVTAGFAGVLLVAQPAGSDLRPLGVAAGALGALAVALVSFHIRDLGRTEPATTTVFWFTLISTAVLLLPLPLVFAPHDAGQWLLLAGIGTMGGIAQMAMTSSLKYAPVSVVVGMDYISLVWSTLAGWLIWSQLPAPATWIGGAIIIGSGLYIAWREHRLQIERAKDVVV